MSNDDFRRELNNTFDQMSGSPSPGLRDRVRSGIAQAPEARGPFWIATVASSNVGPGVPTAGPSATPSPSPSTTPEPQLPAFVCASSVAGQHPSSEPVAFVSDLRIGTHAGYDRLTIDFSNGGPSGAVELKPQSGTTFTQSPSGMSVTTKGRSGILVVIHGADLHSAYNGSVDIVTGYATLVEVKRVEDFEGVVQLGLGVNGTGCYRAFWLSNPDRLVIDVEAANQ